MAFWISTIYIQCVCVIPLGDALTGFCCHWRGGLVCIVEGHEGSDTPTALFAMYIFYVGRCRAGCMLMLGAVSHQKDDVAFQGRCKGEYPVKE